MKRARRPDDRRSRLAAARDLVVIGVGVLVLFFVGVAVGAFDGAQRYLMESGRFDQTLGLALLTLAGLAVFSIRRTAQVARERSLRRDTELQFRTVIEQVPATTYTSDATKPAGEAAILYMSPQVERLLGYPASEWLSDPKLWLHVIHPDDRDRVIEASDTADASGETFRVEYRGVHKDGSIVWIQDESNIVSWDEHGRPLVAQGVMWDITVRKEAELSVRDAEARYRELAENLPVVPYVVTASDGSGAPAIRYVAPGILELSGFSAAEWMARPELWGEIVHPDDRARVGSHGDARSGDTFAAEYRLLRKDGRTIWVSDTAVLVDEAADPSWQGVMQDVTARIEAEVALRDAEERYRLLVEQLPVAIYTDAVDDVSTALYISPQYERLTGYTPEERIARPSLWTEILHPDDREDVLAESRRTNETGSPFEMEYRIIAADGRTVWLHDYATLVAGRADVPIWQGILTDITERKRTAEAIGRRDRILEAAAFAAERFLHVPEWSEALVAVLHRLGASAEASRAYLYRNEHEPSEGLVMELVEEWSAPDVVSSRAFAFNLRWPYADGFEHWIEGLGAGRVLHGPVREGSDRERHEAAEEGTLSHCMVPVFVGGSWWGFIGLDQCDHERIWQSAEIEALRVIANTLGGAINRQAAAAQLAEAEQRFRGIVEHVPAAIYLDRPDRSMESHYVSPQIEAILGVTPERWTSDPRAWIDAIHPDDRDAVLGRYLSAIDGRDPLSSEYRMVRADGRTIWVQDETTYIFDAEGEPIYLQGVISDITERKLAEGALRASEQRERDAAERLRSLDEMKNTFLAAVSHELRSPLTAILGLALTLERASKISEEDRGDLLGRLSTNARKLDRLLRDLLDIDRLGRGLVDAQHRSTDIGELAMRVAESLDVLAGRDVHVAVQPIRVDVDPPKVERIIENLLANAVRHTTHDRQIWLRVEPEGDGVLIAVEDDGPGVMADMREQIFEPFQQGPSTISHTPGTGIGLSLVASFAQLHGGRAWVQERDGGGASFRVFLPGAPTVTAAGSAIADPAAVTSRAS